MEHTGCVSALAKYDPPMRIVSAAGAIAAALVTLLGPHSASAAAATTEIGAVSEIRAGVAPSATAEGGFTVQIGEAAGTYAVPAGYSTITAWSHSTGGRSGTLTFKVYRPTGVAQEFVAVGSDTQTVTAGSVVSFPVRIAVQPGDRIGLSSDDIQMAFETFDLADRIGFFGVDPAIGTTRKSDGEPFGEFKLDVAATLESDPASPGGGVPPPLPAPPPPPPAYSAGPLPAVRDLSIAPRAFRAARRGPSSLGSVSSRVGTRVRYRVNVAARVRFTVRRTRPGRRVGSGSSARCVAPTPRNRTAAACTRSIALQGSFARTSAAGIRSFRFTGRIAGRTLRPGSYLLVATATATAAGRTGKSVRRSFRITR